jgi:hypothetical protein
MTIGAFRSVDVTALYQDLGYRAAPVLVVRDVRDVLASLVTKEYGVTAEEPPLRMRLRRFLADWRLFRASNWPIIRFESLVDQPRSTLQRACGDLCLPWDDAMMNWPKPFFDIVIPGRPGYNDTFVATVGECSLEAAIASWRRSADAGPPQLPEVELDWLEATFKDFNLAHGYPAHVSRDRARPGALPASAYRDGPRR